MLIEKSGAKIGKIFLCSKLFSLKNVKHSQFSELERVS